MALSLEPKDLHPFPPASPLCRINQLTSLQQGELRQGYRWCRTEP